MGLGDYPLEYDRKVHGPYDPARYYGKPDTYFSEVKLGELGAWFGRRNKSPSAVVGALSRAYWRWNRRFNHCRIGNAAYPLQVIIGGAIIGYLINYPRTQNHIYRKYH
nr:PREDICTED: putative ATP synthase subunit f, mitochondrial [Bemisia tabaci]